MGVNYDKYYNNTSVHYISNSGSDENKKYHGGAAGDQTGTEWQLKAWYNRPWTVILRHPRNDVRKLIAQYGIDAALNNNIGYDQYERTSYWYALKDAGYKPANVKVKCEADCTAGVTANVKAVGYILGIDALKNLSTGIYSGNMKEKFVAAGFKAITTASWLKSYTYLLPGDILLYEGHHAATNITKGSKAVEPSEEVTTPEKMVGIVNVAYGDYYVRTKPNRTSSSIMIAKVGTKLGYLGKEENGWYYVTTGTQNGWISKKCGTISDPQLKILVVKKGNWYIRTAPSTSSKAIGNVKGGETVVAQVEEKDGWYLIDYENQNAYISARAIEK